MRQHDLDDRIHGGGQRCRNLGGERLADLHVRGADTHDEGRRGSAVELERHGEQLAGIDQAGVAAGRVVYTKSAEEAIAWVNGTSDGADVAFLLEPTPVAAIVEVAREGDVMPQKSTYFYPKPLTGLVINPHEW